MHFGFSPLFFVIYLLMQISMQVLRRILRSFFRYFTLDQHIFPFNTNQVEYNVIFEVDFPHRICWMGCLSFLIIESLSRDRRLKTHQSSRLIEGDRDLRSGMLVLCT